MSKTDLIKEGRKRTHIAKAINDLKGQNQYKTESIDEIISVAIEKGKMTEDDRQFYKAAVAKKAMDKWGKVIEQHH